MLTTTKAILLVIACSVVSISLLLLPFWIAYASSKGFTQTVKSRIEFSLVCAVLTYGLTAISALPLIPFESFNIFISPMIFGYGYKNTAYILNYLIEHIIPLSSIIVWFISSIMIPRKLKPQWIILIKEKTR
jgi:hypothetical protein